ncbi:hypothetical protein GEOBC_00055, partial [Geobacteraceae bacterium]
APVTTTQIDQTMIWALGSLAPGATVNFNVVAQASNTAVPGASVVNTINATSSTGEESLVNNTASVTTTLRGSDLSVMVSAPASVGQGLPLTYTLTIRNTGLAVAHGAIVTDVLPSQIEYLTHTAPVAVTQNGQTLTWSLNSLPPNAVVTFNVLGVAAEMAVPGTLAANRAEVTTSDSYEENTANNVYTATTTIVGADLRVQKSGPASGVVGREVTYTLTVANQGQLVARNVILTDTLPAAVGFVRQASSYSLTQSGRALTWNLPDLNVGQSVQFEVVAVISPTAALGTNLVNQATASTSRPEGNLTNNTASAQTTVVPGYLFSAELLPAEQTAGIGVTATYQVRIHNTGNLPDQFRLALSGLDHPSWYTLSPAALTLAPGEVGQALVSVYTADCSAAGPHYFNVELTSVGNGRSQVLIGQLALTQQPTISNLSPVDDTTIGSTSMLFNWRTATNATSRVEIWRSDDITNSQTFTGTPGLLHSVNVLGLARNTDYVWRVRSESTCGYVETSTPRTLHVGNGLAFTQRSYNFTIQRDYDQQVGLAVVNQDTLSHTLLLTVTTPGRDDLIVGFVGSGSTDQRITLQPGETRSVVLALHAQDAQLLDYDLVAYLTADDEGTTPIRDAAPVRVHIFVPNINFVLEDIATDPTTLMHTFRVTNQGDPLTDLAVTVNATGTGTLYLTPGINHGYLATGQSLEFKGYPSLDSNFQVLTATVMASAANVSRTVPVVVSLPEGKAVYQGTTGAVSMVVNNSDWYCTNRPVINVKMTLPSGIRRADMDGGKLQLSLRPSSGWHVRPHNLDASLNGNYVGGFQNLIPNGLYGYPFPPEYLNEAAVGPSLQNVQLKTTHLNGGHYVVASGLSLLVCLNDYQDYVVAGSQPEANDIVGARSYLILPPHTLGVQVLAPAAGQKLLAGVPAQITARVNDDVGRPWSYIVTAQTSGDNGSIMLYDDGQHGDGTTQDGVYGGAWLPTQGGTITLTVQAADCQIAGEDSIVVNVGNPTYVANVDHSLPITGVKVLSNTVTPAPLYTVAGIDHTQLGWQQVMTRGDSLKTARFQAQLPDLQAGEVRQVALGTTISYTGESGAGQIQLGPLYVAAPHIIAVTPMSRTVSRGGSVVYEVELYNPGPSADTFTPLLTGLPNDWFSNPSPVLIPAGGRVTRPVTISVSTDASASQQAFAVLARTGTGGLDQASAVLNVIEGLDIQVTPPTATGTNGQVVTYTVTLTNADAATQYYRLTTEDLAPNGVILPAEVAIAANSSLTVSLPVTVYADTGPHPFTVKATVVGTMSEGSDAAVLVVTGDRNVAAT